MFAPNFYCNRERNGQRKLNPKRDLTLAPMTKWAAEFGGEKSVYQADEKQSAPALLLGAAQCTHFLSPNSVAEPIVGTIVWVLVGFHFRRRILFRLQFRLNLFSKNRQWWSKSLWAHTRQILRDSFYVCARYFKLLFVSQIRFYIRGNIIFHLLGA